MAKEMYHSGHMSTLYGVYFWMGTKRISLGPICPIKIWGKNIYNHTIRCLAEIFPGIINIKFPTLQFNIHDGNPSTKKMHKRMKIHLLWEKFNPA